MIVMGRFEWRIVAEDQLLFVRAHLGVGQGERIVLRCTRSRRGSVLLNRIVEGIFVLVRTTVAASRLRGDASW